MKSIGIRELRQYASRYIRLVREGEVVEVTDRGEPVARLVPIDDESPLERLRREGRLTPAKKRLSQLGPPLPAEAGRRSLSAVLTDMRDEERS